MNKVEFKIGDWFTGKGYENAKWAVAVINESLKNDAWGKGYSRKVHAALTKFSSATKNIAREADKLADALPYFHKGYSNEPGAVEGLKEAYHAVYFGMYFGSRLDQSHLDLIAKHASTPEAKSVLLAAQSFYSGFKPIWAAVAYLDSLRPKPVFVFETLSPTGAKLLLDAGYKPETARLPEFVYHKEQDEEGMWVFLVEIVWPEGTLHGKSRFYHGTVRNFQCHACGHAIKNGYNWVPLALTKNNGEIHSFWVGRDCAKKLFGVDMTGEGRYKNTEGR